MVVFTVHVVEGQNTSTPLTTVATRVCASCYRKRYLAEPGQQETAETPVFVKLEMDRMSCMSETLARHCEERESGSRERATTRECRCACVIFLM